MITKKDISNLKSEIIKSKSPIFIQTKDGIIVALVISKKAKDYYQEKGIVAITIYELKKLIENAETKEEAKDIIQTVINTAYLFQGKVEV